MPTLVRVCKVDGSLNGYNFSFSFPLFFPFQLAHSSYDVKHAIPMKWLANPNRGCSHFPHDIRSLYEYLTLYQSEGSCPH